MGFGEMAHGAGAGVSAPGHQGGNGAVVVAVVVDAIVLVRTTAAVADAAAAAADVKAPRQCACLRANQGPFFVFEVKFIRGRLKARVRLHKPNRRRPCSGSVPDSCPGSKLRPPLAPVPSPHDPLSTLPCTAPQVWEEWRDQERRQRGSAPATVGAAAAAAGSTMPSSPTRVSSADVVLCSLERLAEVSGGSSADVRLARSVRWSQVGIWGSSVLRGFWVENTAVAPRNGFVL